MLEWGDLNSRPVDPQSEYIKLCKCSLTPQPIPLKEKTLYDLHIQGFNFRVRSHNETSKITILLQDGFSFNYFTNLHITNNVHITFAAIMYLCMKKKNKILVVKKF